MDDQIFTSSMIPKGLKTPAAIGMPKRLYMLANKKLRRILLTVFLDKSRHATTSNKSFLISTTSAASATKQTKIQFLTFLAITSSIIPATSVPFPMAIPTSACARAGESLIPSPTIATLAPDS